MTQFEMFGNAKWIECPNGGEAPIFRKEFEAKEKEQTVITICGLGFFELKINGKKVSDDLLVPNASNYEERDMSKWNYPLFDKLSFRIYTVKYDITDYLLNGKNVLSVILGGGYYHQELYLSEGYVNYGSPKLCYKIEKPSGEVVSDKSTVSNAGYFKRCNLYYGEFQDLTKKPIDFELTSYNGNDFSLSREISEPNAAFEYQIAPSDKVTDEITDIKLIDEYKGKKLYDIGKNIAGRVVIKCIKANEKITIRYAEQIEGHKWWGIHFDEEKYIDEYITDGNQLEYNTMFGWQGFRYIEVEGDCEVIKAQVIHSNCNISSSFECDNETLNWLYNTYVNTQLYNMHCGVPSDCPHRERLGYTGDGQLCCESGMLTLDSKAFYRKWLNDLADCQCKVSGHVQHSAPAMGGGGGPCGWGGAIVTVPYEYYKQYGDKAVLEEFFPKMLNFFDYLESRSEGGLICKEEEGGWCLGDWLPPQPIQIPEAYVNTCLYIKFMRIVKDIAEILDKDYVIEKLDLNISKCEKAINNAYYSFQQRAFCGDVNGASCLAMSAGIVNDNVKKQIIDKYNNLMEFDTGIIATKELIKYLFAIGENNLAIKLLSNENTVSFNYMMKHGATTLWENWDGSSSQNHPMFGAVTSCLFTDILGIKQSKNSSGYDKIVIAPCVNTVLSRAKGRITTVKGEISVKYEKLFNKIIFEIEVPKNTEAEFIYGEYFCKFSGKKVLEI